MSPPDDDGVHGTVCNAQQYQQSLLNDPHNITCLTHGQSIGLTLTAETSFVSLIAVIVVFVLIGVCPNAVSLVLFHLDKIREEKYSTLQKGPSKWWLEVTAAAC